MNKAEKEAMPIARVQVPVWSDRWMMGDQFGEIVKVTRVRGREIAHVKLDKSGKTLRYLLNECTEVD